jgi:hypothetical protein
MTERSSVETEIRLPSTDLEIRCISKTFDLVSDEQLNPHAAGLENRICGVGSAIMPPSPSQRLRSRQYIPTGGFP